MRTINYSSGHHFQGSRTEESFQFERHCYFVADRKDSKVGKPVFNRTVTLRDVWQK